jgi:hypothetical protein
MGKFLLSLDGPLLKIPTSIKSASFDYVSRYQLIAEIITRYYAFTSTKPSQILDVGGLGSFMGQIIALPITILDSEIQGTNKTEQLGDGAHMDTIKDGAYDVVITSDTLEHIPPKERRNFIQEIIRVSNDLVIVCAPFDDERVVRQEAEVNELYKDLTGKDHRWLAEHKEYGLPPEDVILSYTPKSINPAVIHHSAIQLWGHLMGINLIASEMNDINIHRAIENINCNYNDHFLFKDFSKASYRTFIIMSKKHEIIFKQPAATINQNDIIKLDELIIDLYIEILKHTSLIPIVSNALKELTTVKQTSVELASRNEQLMKQYERVVTSKSWKYTAPARNVLGAIKKGK